MTVTLAQLRKLVAEAGLTYNPIAGQPDPIETLHRSLPGLAVRAVRRDGVNELRARIEALPFVTFNTSTPSAGDYIRRDAVLAALPAPADEEARHEPHPFAESCAHPSHDDAADIHQAATGGPDFTVKDWPVAASAPPASPDPGLLREALDDVYGERNRLVAALANLFSNAAWRGIDPGSPDFTVVYIDLPSGQVSWHIPDAEMAQFPPLPLRNPTGWDGHDTDEKYRRLAALRRGDICRDVQEAVERALAAAPSEVDVGAYSDD